MGEMDDVQMFVTIVVKIYADFLHIMRDLRVKLAPSREFRV